MQHVESLKKTNLEARKHGDNMDHYDKHIQTDLSMSNLDELLPGIEDTSGENPYATHETMKTSKAKIND